MRKWWNGAMRKRGNRAVHKREDGANNTSVSQPLQSSRPSLFATHLLMPPKQNTTTAQLGPGQPLVDPLHQRIALVHVERLEERCDVC